MKIHVIVNGVSYYTTRAAIKKRSSSDFGMQNDALFFVLECMGKNSRFATRARFYDNKMKQHSYDVQLSVCV
jgi:hypothetical protein